MLLTIIVSGGNTRIKQRHTIMQYFFRDLCTIVVAELTLQFVHQNKENHNLVLIIIIIIFLIQLHYKSKFIVTRQYYLHSERQEIMVWNMRFVL